MNTYSEKLKIAALGSGSGSNMQSVLDAINAGSLNAELRLVLSDVADAGILDRARQNNIRHAWLDCSPFKTKLDGAAEQRCIAMLRELEIDTVILAGFMRIVKPCLLNTFPMRVLNIHPALLPAFPGLHAWRQALDYGAKVAGCTVHFVDAGTDTGPVIIQRSVPVMEDDTPETLHARIQTQEHEAYPEALRLLSEGRLSVDGRRVLIRRNV
ncbi:MAG: phosphoribosylglycinamide formyltransferase [Kiritimatiellae bacterium]|nr:phosphoribosylglycinamide formyltransferase [Kiritimatiellia bacterium]